MQTTKSLASSFQSVGGFYCCVTRDMLGATEVYAILKTTTHAIGVAGGGIELILMHR